MTDSNDGGLIRCKCGSLAQLRVTKKGDNMGREYWGCARNFGDKERCNFFQWSEKPKPSVNNNSNPPRFVPPSSFVNNVAASSSSFVQASSSIQHNNSSITTVANNIGSSSTASDDLGAPLCPKHQSPCIQKKVVKEGPNKGKLFWCCSSEHGCYFEWCKEGTKVADYLLNPESQYRPMYSSTHSSKNILGTPYPISLQLVGSNILQQAMKQQKDRHETLVFNNANYDCVLVTFPKKGFVMDKLLRSLKELFENEGKITKLNDLEYLFPLDQHEILRKYFLDVKVEGASIQIHDFPETVKLIINNYPQIDISKTDELCTELDFAHKFPKQVWTKLRPFQKQGVSFAVKRGGRVLLGDEMGVGKTLQGLSTMYYFKQDWPLLIICPSALKHNWGKEIEEWFISDERGHNDITMEKIKIISHGKQTPDNYINIVSYTMAANMLEKAPCGSDGAILNGVKFNCIICDESHYLKNSSTKRSSQIVPFLKQAMRLVMITGTPALSRPVEVFPQLNLLLDERYSFTRSAFIHRYCDAKETQFGIDDKGSSNVLELNYLLSRTVMIRRRKETVLSELPAKQRQRVLLSVKPSDLKQLEFSAEKMKRAVEKMKTALTSEEHNQSNFDKNSEIFKMYTMTGKAKLPAVQEYIQDMIENTGDLKFLVFAYHKEVMDGIEECVATELAKFYNLKGKKSKDLQKQMRGDYYIRIDGSTDSNRRQNLVNTFKTNGHCRVAILSIKAAGVGYTMTPCSTVLFAELYWTPSDLRQAEDRVHRIGQKNAVSIKYLLGKDTFDEYLWPLLQKKLDVVGKSVDGESHVDTNVDQVVFDRTNTYSDNEDEEEIEKDYLNEEEEEEYYEEMERLENEKKKSPKITKAIEKESPKPKSQSSSNTNNANRSEQIQQVIPPPNSTATDFLKGFLCMKNGKLPPNIVLMRDDNASLPKKVYTYNRSFRDSDNNKKKRPLETENIEDDEEEDIVFGTPKKKPTAQTKTSPFFSKGRSLLPNTSSLQQKLPSSSSEIVNSKASSSSTSNENSNNIPPEDDFMHEEETEKPTNPPSFLTLSNAFKRQSEPQTPKFLPPVSKFVLPNSLNKRVETQTPPPKLLSTSSQIPSIPSPVGNVGKPSTPTIHKISPSSISSNRNPPSDTSQTIQENKPSDLAQVLAKYSFQGTASLSPFSRASSSMKTPNKPPISTPTHFSSAGSNSSSSSTIITNSSSSSSTTTSATPKFVPPIFKSPLTSKTSNGSSSVPIQKSPPLFLPPKKQNSIELESKKVKIDNHTPVHTTPPKSSTPDLKDIDDSDFILDDTILPDIL